MCSSVLQCDVTLYVAGPSRQEYDMDLLCVAMFYNVLQCVAVCCSVLQCVALCCSVLQCVAVCCGVLQCDVTL